MPENTEIQKILFVNRLPTCDYAQCYTNAKFFPVIACRSFIAMYISSKGYKKFTSQPRVTKTRSEDTGCPIKKVGGYT